MWNTFRVGYYLAIRQLFRNNLRTLLLIISVMTLSFLSLVAISGILVGLIEGSSVAFRAKLVGDLVISPLENKKVVQDTDAIINLLSTIPEVKAFAVRNVQGGTIESNYKERDAGKRKETTNPQIVGINPEQERIVTKWQDDILEGEFLSGNDTGKIVLGKNLLAKYAQVSDDAERALGEVIVGDRVLVTIEGKVNEFVVKGILGGKTDASRFAYISSTDIKKIIDNGDTRATGIIVRAYKEGQENKIKSILVDNDLDKNQKIQTYAEGEPAFVRDLKKVFSILGGFIGAIGIVTSSITIYIIIYINAITRRKYIGIMKGIGISPAVIEVSYVIQSVFYGLIGSAAGAFIVYLGLIPLLNAYPIDFPFSDGILVAPYYDTFIKFSILMFFTLLAGYVPANSIVKQNTLNAILGR